ncbi:hypothetical protein K431DRAFT_283677 [Polychaeton citri CBS 116435]|uniref:Ribosomal protein L10 n=1 Tax=Polychaeton citri CBS 116435 TaxID=1314669 RepID=A0A9P4Q932_9PEZI|nr:hypothetical protein K431DRAFT_283677 [Polychaeton citri CBS 116435]
MPPRIRVQPQSLRYLSRSQDQTPSWICVQCRFATTATPITPAPPLEQTVHAVHPITRYPSTQPPSHKRPEFRKTQLHRQYQSLLRSTPLFLIFQHNNVKATEWSGMRRELAEALHKVDEEIGGDVIGKDIKLNVVQTGIFASALRVTEFWDPNFSHAEAGREDRTVHPTDPRTASSAAVEATTPSSDDVAFTHGLSRQAWEASKKNRQLNTGLEPLLSGPLALLTFPAVSPQHVKAALTILAPQAPNFPAPKRKVNPGYYEPAVQHGLQKLMLLGARVEGKVFDMEGTRWIGGIPGGLDGLRGQLVAMLSSVGAGVTNTLEAASRSLYLTMEGRKGMLEEQEKGEKTGEDS